MIGTAAAVWIGAPAARAGVHVVQPGETLSEIAHRYGTSVERLARRNDVGNPDLIVAGRRLRVPARARVPSVHVVRSGETLSSIAGRYGTTVRALTRANRIKDPDLIVTGTTLRIAGHWATAVDIEVSLEDHARVQGVETSLVKAVAWHESGWKQDVVSDAGAIGVMQVMPDTARFVNDSLGGGGLDVGAAKDNVELGVRYLGHLLHTMPTERKALAAYVSGPNAVQDGLEDYQKRYVEDVEALKQRF